MEINILIWFYELIVTVVYYSSLILQNRPDSEDRASQAV